MTAHAALLISFGLPLLLALALLLQPTRGAALKLAPLAALPALATALLLSVPINFHIPWLLLGTDFGLDQTGRIFLFFTALLWLCAGIYSTGYIKDPKSRSSFFVWFLLAMSGNFGLIISLDLISFFLFFTQMSLCSYGLVIHERSPEALRAGRIYIILVLIGEVLLFTGMAMAADATEELNFSTLHPALATLENPHLIMALMLLGFGIKAGLIGLHVWLPLAHPVAPTPASAVLSGAMIKAGLLGWLRILPLGEIALPTWGELFIIIGLIGAFYGVLVGLTQQHPKTVLAYSSISQMGIVTVGVGLGLSTPSSWPLILTTLLIYTLHHGLAKGALFLGVGMAAKSSAKPLERLVVIIGLLIPALSIVGAPLTSGMLAKALLKGQLAAAPTPWEHWLEILLPWSSVATTLILARFLYLVWPQTDSATKSGIPTPLWLSWLLLLTGVCFSVWFIDLPDTAAIWSAKTLLSSSWPILLGAIITGSVLLLWQKGIYSGGLTLPPGDILVIVERLLKHMPQPQPTEHKHGKTLPATTQSSAAIRAITAPELLIKRWATAICLFLFTVLLIFSLLALNFVTG